MRQAVRVVDGAVRLVVRGKPRSSREGLEIGDDGSLVVRVRAPPVDGAANTRLVEVVADLLSVRKSDVSVVRGESARHKELEIRGLSLDDVVLRLSEPRLSEQGRGP